MKVGKIDIACPIEHCAQLLKYVCSLWGNVTFISLIKIVQFSTVTKVNYKHYEFTTVSCISLSKHST